jgi:hypothetical protein
MDTPTTPVARRLGDEAHVQSGHGSEEEVPVSSGNRISFFQPLSVTLYSAYKSEVCRNSDEAEWPLMEVPRLKHKHIVD